MLICIKVPTFVKKDQASVDSTWECNIELITLKAVQFTQFLKSNFKEEIKKIFGAQTQKLIWYPLFDFTFTYVESEYRKVDKPKTWSLMKNPQS